MLAFTSIVDQFPLWVIFVPLGLCLLMCVIGFIRSVPYGDEQ